MWVLEFAKRSTFVIVKSYTFNTKTTIPSGIFLKKFSFKMFPNLAMLREHSANIPGILRAGWALKQFTLLFRSYLFPPKTSLNFINTFLGASQRFSIIPLTAEPVSLPRPHLPY